MKRFTINVLSTALVSIACLFTPSNAEAGPSMSTLKLAQSQTRSFQVVGKQVPMFIGPKSLTNTTHSRTIGNQWAMKDEKNKYIGRSFSSFNKKEIPSFSKKMKEENNLVDRKSKELYIQLINVAKKGNIKEIQELLDHGADINHQLYSNRGVTPLSQAIHNGVDLEVIQFLLDKGAKVNLRDFDGKNALHYAATAPIFNAAVVGELLDKGANIIASDRFGYTPLGRLICFGSGDRFSSVVQWAKSTKNDKVLEILIDEHLAATWMYSGGMGKDGCELGEW